MPLPESLDVENALIFFHAYMYGPLQGKLRLYRARELHPRMAMSEDWEVFASILVRDTGSAGMSGLDLEQYEVKSVQGTSSGFEYQYHRDSWQVKLAADRQAGHLFVVHQEGLRHVEVHYCDGEQLDDYFEKWEGEEPYADDRQQRFRRTVGQNVIRQRGTLILRIEDGEATYVRGSN